MTKSGDCQLLGTLISSIDRGFRNTIYVQSCMLRSGKSLKLKFFQSIAVSMPYRRPKKPGGKLRIYFMCWHLARLFIPELVDCNFSFHFQFHLAPPLHVWMVVSVPIKEKYSNVHVLKITMVTVVKLKVIFIWFLYYDMSYR